MRNFDVMKDENRIVITGVGPLSAGGSGKDEVWKSISERRTGLVKKTYEIDGDNIGEFYVHEIKNFSINDYGINQQVLGEIKSWKQEDEIIDLFYFLAVIKMAIDDSGLKIDEENKFRTGLILAHENMGLDHFYMKVIDELSFAGKADRPKTKKEFLEEFYKKFNRTGYELQTFMSLHHIAKIFDIHGYSLFLNNACASGLFAFEAAADTIRSGKCERMIIAAVDKCSLFKQIWFQEVNMLAKDGRIKPFVSDRDGFTIGEGGAAFMLEKLGDAIKRKAHIYAKYLGGSFVLEGWKVTYPDVSNNLYESMIRDALTRSGIKPSDIGLIIPHGVGTNITDRYEAKALTQVFGKKTKRPIISAFKPYIGHTLGSTAILETAIMLLGLKNGEIPQTLNCENIDDALGINVLRESREAGDIKIAMKTACGFAGYDGACVFKNM